ncbi:MAG TPA: hydroxyethylthiazole kinase, partial [bacterium]|nr:hydroxyethylthiazole kinase [bacterium]
NLAGVDVLLLSPMKTATGRRQMDEALAAARHLGMPVVIDLTGALKLRRSVPAVRRMIAAATWPVLSSTSDELAVFSNPAGKRTDPVRLAAEILQSGGLAAIRGSTGMVTNGKNALRVDAGHDWLETAAPAGGLAAGSIAAFLSVAHLADFITVTAVALACLGQAADRASRRAKSQPMEKRVVKELGALSAGAAR